LLARAPRSRKSTASGQGEGSWKPGRGVEKGEPQITQSSPDLGYGSWMTGETIRKERARASDLPEAIHAVNRGAAEERSGFGVEFQEF
jgi:hypothetical protein